MHAAPRECWAFGGRVGDSGGESFPVGLVIRLMFPVAFIGPNRILKKGKKYESYYRFAGCEYFTVEFIKNSGGRLLTLLYEVFTCGVDS